MAATVILLKWTNRAIRRSCQMGKLHRRIFWTVPLSRLATSQRPTPSHRGILRYADREPRSLLSMLTRILLPMAPALILILTVRLIPLTTGTRGVCLTQRRAIMSRLPQFKMVRAPILLYGERHILVLSRWAVALQRMFRTIRT